MWYVIFHLILFSFVPFALKQTFKSPQFNIAMVGEHYVSMKWNGLLVCGIIIYSVFVGFAYDTGQDYWHYYDHYISSVYGLSDWWGSGREVGYQYLIQKLAMVFSSPAAFFVLCALFNNFAWANVSSLFGKASSVVMWLLYLNLYPLSMNLYRQYIAMAFLIIAYCVVTRKNYSFRLKDKANCFFIILLLLAFLFHTSSIAGMFLYFLCFLLCRININKWILLGSVAIVSISANTILVGAFEQFNIIVQSFQTISGKGYEFEEMLDTQWGESRMIYVLMVIHLIYVWYADKVLKATNGSRFLFYAMVLSFILIPISLQEILLRIRIYMAPFMSISIALTLYYNIKQKGLGSNIPLIFAFIVDLAYICFNLYNLGEFFPLQYKI